MEDNKFGKKLFILIAIIELIIRNKLNYNNIINSSIISYSLGAWQSCYINNSYKMKCFGFNENKQLGLGDSTDTKGDQPNEMGSNLAYVDPGTIDNAKFKSVYWFSSYLFYFNK